MNEREVEKLVTDANDAWRPASERTDACTTPSAAPRADAQDIPEHIRRDCAERAPGCTPVPDGHGGWRYERPDRRSDGATGERVQRISTDGALRG